MTDDQDKFLSAMAAVGGSLIHIGFRDDEQLSLKKAAFSLFTGIILSSYGGIVFAHYYPTNLGLKYAVMLGIAIFGRTAVYALFVAWEKRSKRAAERGLSLVEKRVFGVISKEGEPAEIPTDNDTGKKKEEEV